MGSSVSIAIPIFVFILMSVQVQLPSYNFTKRQLVDNNILPADSTWTFLASSAVSGMCVVCSSGEAVI